MYAQAPAPRTRPTTVTVSSYLLYVTAAVSLISAVLSLTEVSTITGVYRDAYAGTSAEGAEAVIVATTVIGVVLNILFAAGLAILAIFNNRGRQAARVTTWVIGGISLCCSGLGLAGTAVTGSMNLSTGDGPSPSDVEQRLADALPSWYMPVTVTLSAISLLSILGAIILLALPASNAYFRPAQAAWDPSMPYPQYGTPYPGQAAPGQPQYPGQPPYPGQPQYPGQSAYPGQSLYPGQPQYPGQPEYPAYPEQPTPPPPDQSGSPGPSSSPPSNSSPSSPSSPYRPSSPDELSSGTSSGPSTPPPGLGGDPAPPPHTGFIPPSDPWSRPPAGDKRDRPPADPTSDP
jgi:hypothetical protein